MNLASIPSSSAALCRPSQVFWLKLASSMPPTSETMPTFRGSDGAAVAGTAVAGAAVAGTAVAGTSVGVPVSQPANADKTSTTTSMPYIHLRIFSSPQEFSWFGSQRQEVCDLADEPPPPSYCTACRYYSRNRQGRQLLPRCDSEILAPPLLCGKRQGEIIEAADRPLPPPWRRRRPPIPPVAGHPPALDR